MSYIQRLRLLQPTITHRISLSPLATKQLRHVHTSTPPRRLPIGLLSGGLALTLGLSLTLTPSIHADSAAQHLGHASASTQSQDNDTIDTTLSLGSLIRSYAVFTMCSIPLLVDSSPRVLSVLSSIPGIKQITEAFVRVTFFEQFVGGDTAHETIPLLHTLRSSNKGTLFAYSVEVDEAEASGSKKFKKGKPVYKRNVDEMIRCIDVAADFEDEAATTANAKSARGRRTWVALKFTALLPDAHALTKLSSHIIATRPAAPTPIAFPGSPTPTDLDILRAPAPNTQTGLTQEDVESLCDLHADLFRICTRAQERGVKIIIDAEYSWYQPAVDALALSLMRHFNKLPDSARSQDTAPHPPIQPLIYGTYQAYLRRTPAHIAQSLLDAKLNNYALGVKLVRGAYHPHEIAAHTVHSTRSPSLSISPDPQPPVWTTKAETDACYDACAAVLIGAIKDDMITPSPGAKGKPAVPTVGVLFGTHNWTSCDLILDGLVGCGLALREEGVVRLGEDVTERLTLGQLYGMSDALTDYLVSKTRSSSPLIIKYVPYGALSEVMPYLGRRAIENKSILGDGGAADERRRAGAEIWKRLFG